MHDLHCHLLPGIDDGPTELAVSLEMARMAVADGIQTVACTPHIYPGLYENNAQGIRRAIEAMRKVLAAHDIPLQLVEGADVHLAPDLLEAIRDDLVPTLAGSRYLLFEPPHHVAPPRLEETIFGLMTAGIVPVITHPERLSWVENHYALFERLARRGVWLQVTAGALTGRFGRRPRYWAERFVGEGLTMLLATDAHDPRRRPPLLAEGREAAARLIGATAAQDLVVTHPAAILQNSTPVTLPAPPEKPARSSMWSRLWRSE
ncbi:MAG: hypothetical protein QM769_04900 [Pseudoxanthomonas sp.]